MATFIANVTRAETWKNNPLQYVVSFESMQPFLDIGITAAQLANKTFRNRENTLFVYKPNTDDIIKLGPTKFTATHGTYPLITFIGALENEEYDTYNNRERLRRIEESLESLTKLVHKLLAFNNIDVESSNDSDGDSD